MRQQLARLDGIRVHMVGNKGDLYGILDYRPGIQNAKLHTRGGYVILRLRDIVRVDVVGKVIKTRR